MNTCSQATFAKKNLLSDLGIQGKKTSITVKTKTEEVTYLSETVEDLEITPESNGKAGMVWLKLSCTYTEEDLTVNRNEVVTVNELKDEVI